MAKSVRYQFLVVGLGQGGTQLISMARNLYFASLLSISDFGIGAIYLIAASAAEMLNDFHIDKYIISKKNGIRKSGLRAIAGILLIKGLLVSLLFFTVAFIYLKIYDGYSGVLIIALLPLLLSMTNLMIKYEQRHKRHLANFTIEVVSQVLATACVFVFSIEKYGHYSILYSILILHCSKVIFSFLICRPIWPIFLNLNASLSEPLKFGLSLWINNLVLFGTIQGDRILVATFYDSTSIGVYALGYTFAYGVYGFLSRALVQIGLPLCARSTGNSRLKRYDVVRKGIDILTVFLMLAPLFSPYFLEVVNDAYLPYSGLISLVALTFFVRVSRISSNLILTVEMRTNYILNSSYIKLSFLLLFFLLVNIGLSLTILLCSIVLLETLINALMSYRTKEYGGFNVVRLSIFTLMPIVLSLVYLFDLNIKKL